MIAELRNSKNLTMQEDAGDIDPATTAATVAATVPATVIIKDERTSSVSSASASIGAAATAAVGAGAGVGVGVGAVAAGYLQPRHVVFKDESESGCGASESTQTSYKRRLMFAMGHDDDDDDGPSGAAGGSGGVGGESMEMLDIAQPTSKKFKLCAEREQMFELFQPWALKTYGDQAKTKTITLRKKARILKALEGKEHSRPDSSKFRFWVKSKAFTTKRPECFQNAPDYPASSNTEYPNNIDLYVASTTKDFGQRTYRKVAVVEEFFNIIYNIHVEMGGRSGRHAGQKRTYRIITETFAFLPREAVTRFLSACPECKKNLRPLSPGRSTADDDIPNESSTEIDVLNYSPQTDSSMEIVKPSTPTEDTERVPPLRLKRKSLNPSPVVPKEELATPTDTSTPVFTYPPTALQKIRVNPVFQTQSFQTEPISNVAPSVTAGGSEVCSPQMNFGMLNRESLIRYYDFMRRLYGHSMQTQTSLPPAVKPDIEVKPPSEAIDLTADDRPTTSSSAAAAMRSKSVQPAAQLPVVQKQTQQTCAINLSKSFSSPTLPAGDDRPVEETKPKEVEKRVDEKYGTQSDLRKVKAITPLEEPAEEHETQLDLRKVKPITSTYLQLTRSMGLSDADALKFDDLEPPMPTPPVPDTASDGNSDDPYAGLMKDADKLKLMLLAWNYQNSNAVRNGTEGPDLGVVGGLWAQYQNALAQNATKIEPSNSPVPRTEESSPVENQDETNSSGQKEEDEGSEDDSDDKMAQDPERLKAFNMFVRLFVDENLDRIIPISKQPKEKIQAIIDSCARQFPEFGERSRKRIRTYLKSCRRNKKAREGWDNTTRPTPAHLTSVQAEQILAIACENESMNAKRMRIGLDPITQAVPLTTTTSSTSTAVSSDAAATSTPFTSGFRSTPSLSTSESEALAPTATSTQGATSSARSSPLALSTTSVAQPIGGGGTALSNGNTTVSSVGAIPASSPLYRPTDFTSPTSTSPYAARTPAYPSYFPAANATPTDLSMKPSSVPQQPTQSITSTAAATSSSLSPNTRPPPPLVTHKLSTNEITAARQVITAYRESAAFLLRTADQVEQLLVQQQ